MNIGIIFFAAIANGFLQAMTKNIIYGYVFFIFTLGAMAIDLYNKKFGKIFMTLIFCLYAFLLFVCVYNHFVYDVILYDYIIISVETIIVAILTIIAILPPAKTIPRASNSGDLLFLNTLKKEGYNYQNNNYNCPSTT
jgi:hypothetical protein